MGFSKPAALLAAQSEKQALHHSLGKQAFVKENEKKTSVLMKSVKSLRYADKFLLESYQLHIITKYKASSKVRPDLPNLFSCFKSMKSAKFRYL